jgi:hypothetical protein
VSARGAGPTARRSPYAMLKVIAWIVGIVFLIGLLVVFGLFDLIF